MSITNDSFPQNKLNVTLKLVAIEILYQEPETRKYLITKD